MIFLIQVGYVGVQKSDLDLLHAFMDQPSCLLQKHIFLELVLSHVSIYGLRLGLD